MNWTALRKAALETLAIILACFVYAIILIVLLDFNFWIGAIFAAVSLFSVGTWSLYDVFKDRQ